MTQEKEVTLNEEQQKWVDVIQTNVDKVDFNKLPFMNWLPELVNTADTDTAFRHTMHKHCKAMKSSSELYMKILENGGNNIKIEDYYRDIAIALRDMYVYIVYNNLLASIITNEGGMGTYEAIEAVSFTLDTSLPVWVHDDMAINAAIELSNKGLDATKPVPSEILSEFLYMNMRNLVAADMAATPLTITIALIFGIGSEHYERIYEEAVKLAAEDKLLNL